VIERSYAINASLGARRTLAYNLISLGEIYWKTGDLRKARQMQEQAMQEMSPSQDIWGKIGILVGSGTVFLKMGDPSGAARRFNEAYELAKNLGSTPGECDAAAGLAACALMQGLLDEARKYANEAWDNLKAHGLVALENPAIVYRDCAEVFEALGDEASFKAVLESGYQALMEVANKITLPEWRQSFLENETENRAFMELWERSKL